MIQQSIMHTSRVSRRNITKTAFNNNSSTLIDNALFGPDVTNRTMSLSATDIIDTLSATAQAIASLSFNTNDIIDTIESNIEVIVSSALSVTSATDTLESSAENIVSTELDATDLIDTSEISAQLDRILTLEATETIDTAIIRANGGTEKKKRDGALAVWSFLKRLRKPLNAKIKVTESQDTMQAEAILQYSAKIKASEQRDGIVFLTQNSAVISAQIVERQDTAFADHIEHKIKSDKIYSDYEAHEMAIFALAS